MPDDCDPASTPAQPGEAASNPPPGSGESGGGAYPNPHTGKKPSSGIMGHGGQTTIFEKQPGSQIDPDPGTE